MAQPLFRYGLGLLGCFLAACSTPTPNAAAQHSGINTAALTVAPTTEQNSAQTTQPSTTALTSPDLRPQKTKIAQAGQTTQGAVDAPLFVPFRQHFKQADGQLSPYLEQWGRHLSNERDIPFAVVEKLLLEVEYEPQVISLMTPSKVSQRKRSWPAYRQRFVEPTRIQAGLDFWQAHADTIATTAQQYQVPAAILVAIVGVETIYGRYMGDFKVLNALANLGFSYPDPQRPERAAMFRNQLADFIELHHKGKVNALQARGSYAGAMGLPQFMPTSIKNWAIDARNTGAIDLYQSVPDSLASIANFLNHHGWVANWPVFVDIVLPDDHATAALVDGGLAPTLSWAQVQQQFGPYDSIEHLTAAPQEQKYGLIDLVDQPKNTVEYRLATPNFFALTAYNRSYFYASSVADLACELEQRMLQQHACSLWAQAS